MGKDPSAVTPGASRAGTPSRCYLHQECQGITRVDGHEFLVLADPFSVVSTTLCTGCGNYVPFDDVVWDDTNESIDSYRRRVHDGLPFWKRTWAYAAGPLVGGLLGTVVGTFWPPAANVPNMFTGLVGGLIGGWLVLQMPARKYLGLDFRGQK